jgi:hypothetical protein
MVTAYLELLVYCSPGRTEEKKTIEHTAAYRHETD